MKQSSFSSSAAIIRVKTEVGDQEFCPTLMHILSNLMNNRDQQEDTGMSAKSSSLQIKLILFQCKLWRKRKESYHDDVRTTKKSDDLNIADMSEETHGAKDVEIGADSDSDKKTLVDRKKPGEAETDQHEGV